VAIDWTVFQGLGCAIPKGRVKALLKEDKTKAIAAIDTLENAIAKVRAKGQCEVQVRIDGRSRKGVYARCTKKDTQTHHLIGGIGRRNRGESIKAHKKLRVCDECHDLITRKILKPTTAEHDADTVRYVRSK
jgi:hypothetical protein